MSTNDNVIEILNEIEQTSTASKSKNRLIKDYIIIDINSVLIGLQLEYLREVFDLTKKDLIVTIPYTPDYVMGIISVRDEIIPVLSLLSILNIDKNKENYSKIVILEDKIKIAIPFTDIIDLKSLDISNIKEVKNATLSDNKQFINQEFDYNNNLISIVDLKKVFSSEYCL